VTEKSLVFQFAYPYLGSADPYFVAFRNEMPLVGRRSSSNVCAGQNWRPAAQLRSVGTVRRASISFLWKNPSLLTN